MCLMKIKRQKCMVVTSSDVQVADGLAHDNELKAILTENVKPLRICGPE